MNTPEKIDVLAVMDAAIARLPDSEAAPLDEARAAVAELAEAVRAMLAEAGPRPLERVRKALDTLDKGWATPEQNITISSGDVIVASYSTGYSEYPDDSVNEANAQLIAAAPELLAACRLLVADDLTGDQLANRIAYGRAAIAKATGEQP